MKSPASAKGVQRPAVPKPCPRTESRGQFREKRRRCHEVKPERGSAGLVVRAPCYLYNTPSPITPSVAACFDAVPEAVRVDLIRDLLRLSSILPRPICSVNFIYFYYTRKKRKRLWVFFGGENGYGLKGSSLNRRRVSGELKIPLFAEHFN
jgi:hypothetical protein